MSRRTSVRAAAFGASSIVLLALAAAPSREAAPSPVAVVADRTLDAAPPAQAAAASARAAALAAFRERPVVFAANVGQGADGARFVARGGGLSVQCARDAVWVQLVERAAGVDGPPVRVARVALRFEDAAPGAAPHGEAPAVETASWFTPNVAGVAPTFNRVRYEDLAPGVDLVLRGDGGAVQYDLHLAPGADLDRVTFVADGAEALEFAGDGALVVRTSAGDLRQAPPIAWQTDADGARLPVPSRFRRLGGLRYGFEVDGRDPSLPLTVDPVLSYSTYLGGAGDDAAYAVDSVWPSEAVIAGRTLSADFPLTPGAADPSAVGVEAFVCRLRNDGGQVLASTYLGGAGDDVARAVRVGPDGSTYVAGATDSPDFPVTPGAPGAFPAGGTDAFVARLSADGSVLLLAARLGGPGDDAAHGLAVDPSTGAIRLGGVAAPGFPSTPGALQPLHAGGDDGFVAEFAPGGGAITWATFLGGAGDDSVLALAADPGSGEIAAAGKTASTDFPVQDAWRPVHGGLADGFVARLKPGGAQLAFATFLGGAGDDSARAVSVDAFGATLAAGDTDSADFPVTPGAFDVVTDARDAFAVVLDGTGAPWFSTLFGGSGDDEGRGAFLDAGGAVHLCGATTSSDLPVSVDAAQATLAGGADGWYAKIGYDGSYAAYATYLGGAGEDAAEAVFCDANGGVFVVGAAAAGFPTTPGAAQSAFAGGVQDAFAWATVFCTAKPSVSSLGGGCGVPTAPILTSTNGLLGQTFTLTLSDAPPGAPAYLFVSAVPFANLPLGGGCEVALDPGSAFPLATWTTDGAGQASLALYVTPDSACCGLELAFQALVYGAGQPLGVAALSNGVRTTFGG
ncbi:MAG TPA: hypothetical protein VEI02_16495 [Planctomycetota bacterium]|nr:hypothetical protein [Planctomycetota bacterium]